MSKVRAKSWVVGVLWITAVIRIYGFINISPPGLAHDEVANWLIDRSILAGNHAIYFTRAYGHEAGFHYVQAIFVALLGDNLLALRLPTAFAGLLGVAVSYALVRKMFNKDVALISTILLAVLFFPVFYSRLALRAIFLPLFSSLSAYFWWQALPHSPQPSVATPSHPRSLRFFLLSGLFVGLSLHTYLAARALPIFYGLYIGYLSLFHWQTVKKNWRGLVAFTAVILIIAAPLINFLLANPNAEFRVDEVSAPLQALLAGDFQPVWQNGLHILAGFGLSGDPLWRQNVAEKPIFDPIVGTLFYGGILLSLWRIRDGRYAFLLLWLVASIVPSLITINAPSNIRMINLVPLLTVLPTIMIWAILDKVMHNLPHLSTVIPNLSTETVKICGLLALTLIIFHGIRTINLVFNVWPTDGEVRFVWQVAMKETAVSLDNDPSFAPVAIGGWSPDTLDSPSLTLHLQRDELAISHFNPQEGTLIIPAAQPNQPIRIFHPTMLELDQTWKTQLIRWGATQSQTDNITQYSLPKSPLITPQHPTDTLFNGQIRLLGYDVGDQLITYWQVETVPDNALRLFVHLLDREANILAEAYALDTEDPQALWTPHWQMGDIILQKHNLPQLDQATSFRIGFFDPYNCKLISCPNMLTETNAQSLLLPLTP